MSGFRGTDEQLDREITALEQIARMRVRRAAADLRELDRDLTELRRERARRRAPPVATVEATEASTVES